MLHDYFNHDLVLQINLDTLYALNRFILSSRNNIIIGNLLNFATLEFAFFFIVVYLVYFFLPHRQQNYLLLIASYFFYGFWDWRFLSLFWFSILVNFWIGKALGHTDHPTTRRRLLMVSVLINLGIIGTFKYLGFFIESAADALRSIGFEPHFPVLSIVLPIGISFYTFQTMSYVIDVYRQKLRHTDDFVDFSLFITFFPQLVAGPIERATNLLPQVQTVRTLSFDQFTQGSYLILLGLFKKIVIADGVASTVNAVYSMDAKLTALDIIVATYLFSIQIYCDFSGYSDIARGTAKLLGIELMTNFRLPFFAINPQDFWNRWHISLSTWLRDYLYIPLGGSRNGEIKTHRNLLITFFLSGLWHGAAWHFILWGVYHAGLLSIHRIWRTGYSIVKPTETEDIATPAKPFSWHRVMLYAIGILFFYQLMAYGWMIFRVESLAQLVQFTKILLFQFSFHLSINFSIPIVTIAAILVLFILELTQFITNNALFYRQWPIPVRTLLYAIMFFILTAGTSNVNTDFIYFAF